MVKTPKNKSYHLSRRFKPRKDELGEKKLQEKTELSRCCLATREILPITKMIRFCLSPDGVLFPDLGRKLSGKGLWIQADKDILASALQKRLFAKALRKNVKYPEDMDAMIVSLFHKRLQDLLGVAKKSGLLVIGFEKVSEALRKQSVPFLLEATDAGVDSNEKLARLKGQAEIIQILSSQQMTEAVGAGICVHAALKSGGATDLFVAEVRRFSAYCKNII